MKAAEIIMAAANVLDERGAERDQEGERSMRRAIEIFNEMACSDNDEFVPTLTEKQGWLFMVALKLARAERSDNPDHYVDLVGYIALLGEHVLEGSQDAGLTAPKTQAVSDACTEIPAPSPWIQHDDKQLSRERYPLGLDPEEVVEVTLRNGNVRKGPVSLFCWNHVISPTDIIFYRKASNPEEKEKEEGVVHEHTCRNCGHTYLVTPVFQHCPACSFHHDYQYPL